MAKTTLTSMRQFISVIDTSAGGILCDVQHLRRMLGTEMSPDVEYLLESIEKSANAIRDGFGE